MTGTKPLQVHVEVIDNRAHHFLLTELQHRLDYGVAVDDMALLINEDRGHLHEPLQGAHYILKLLRWGFAHSAFRRLQLFYLSALERHFRHEVEISRPSRCLDRSRSFQVLSPLGSFGLQ